MPSYQTKSVPSQQEGDKQKPQNECVQQFAKGPQHSIKQVQLKSNNTGLPDQLKSGIEQLSGYSMNDVKVHRNSSKPAQLNAHAYAQGTDIHLGPGQERHLPHEAWHVVQQKQGRVKPTLQMKSGVPVNDNAGLEKEADVMGEKALQGLRGMDNQSETIAQRKPLAGKNKQLKLNTYMSPALVKQTKTFYKGNAKNDCKNNPCIQMQTVYKDVVTANYKYGTALEKVGQSVTAYIDPNDPQQGSSPGSGEQQGLMNYLRDVSGYKSMKKGHLINDNVGGPGIAANLYPITTKANGEHLRFAENHVKKNLISSHVHGGHLGIKYKVTVTNSQNDAAHPDASFLCEAYPWTVATNTVDSSNPIANVRIDSKPQSGTTGTGGHYFPGSWTGDSMTVRNSQLPSGWGQGGSGRGPWSGSDPSYWNQ
ncbi:MAG: hypothetical protein ACI9LM_002301 [Alteromonadaceae bacterium]|jgi:hypothetical protein